MTCALIANAALFILYMIVAGVGIIWLKVILAILTCLVAVACIGFLYISKELTKPRSLWMSTAAIAIVVCLLFSLILNFPSPNKYKTQSSDEMPDSAAVTEFLL